MEQRLERIEKMMEAMIIEQKELTKKLLCKMDEISRTWDARLNSPCHYIKHVEENSTPLVEVQRLQQSDNLAIATHDGGVKQCNKVVASLKKIQQTNIQKLAPEPEPEPEPDEHDTCSKYMRTTTSRHTTKFTHNSIHTFTDSPETSSTDSSQKSTDSPQGFCWVHYQPQGSGPIPFPESPPPSPDAAPLVDSIFERAPTEWGSDMKSQEDLEGMKTAFLLGYDASFREQTPPDIHLRPHDDETPIPAHRGVLAARSKILGMPDLDGSYGRGGMVELPESREELEPLLEFLYFGSLPEEKMQKHFMTLFKSAYKYEIPYLWELCAHYSLSSFTSSNDTEVIYSAYCCRHRALLEAALKLIVEEAQQRICCEEFLVFVFEHPLMLKLTRMAFVVCRKT